MSLLVSAEADWYEATWDKGIIDTQINEGFELEIRRIRFFSAGQIYNIILNKLQFDFEGDDVQISDAHITNTRILNIGKIQFGSFREPIGWSCCAAPSTSRRWK